MLRKADIDDFLVRNPRALLFFIGVQNMFKQNRDKAQLIYDAIDGFRASDFTREIMGAEVHERYAEQKLATAQRCPRLLGTLIKRAEVQFHHEVTNQYLWGQF